MSFKKMSFLALFVSASLTFSERAARASFTFSIVQSGNNVDVTGEGTLNLAAFSQGLTNTDSDRVQPDFNMLVVGPIHNVPVEEYGTFSGPTNFGPGGYYVPNSGAGDLVGVIGRGFEVPQGYVSGTMLSDSELYFGVTLSYLGMTPGTYVYTWGSGPTADSLTINIGTVPEPASFSLIAAPIAIAALRRRRRHLV